MTGFLPALRERVHALLRFSERYTKTDMVYLAGNGSWLALGQVAIALIAFGLSIAFAHYVPKDVYGTYRFLLSLFWTLTAFSLTGLPAALVRAVARGDDSAYRSAFGLSILWSLPMVVISLGVGAYYWWQGNHLLALGGLLIAVVGPLMQSAYLYGSFLEGKRKFRENALLGIVLNFVPALALLIVMVFSRSVLALFATYLIANTITGLSICFFVYLHHRPKAASTHHELMNLGGHFSVMNVLNTIAQQIDRLLVYHYLGAVELALYTFAVALPDQVKSLCNNVATLAFPKFANRPLHEIRATLRLRLFGFTGLMVVAALGYIIIAPFVFHLFFPAYAGAVIYSQVYAIALIPIGSIIPVTILEAHAAKRALYIFNIVSPLVQTALTIGLVITHGILGAVIARIIGRVVSFVLSLILVERASA